jgi:hypothetical protein
VYLQESTTVACVPVAACLFRGKVGGSARAVNNRCGSWEGARRDKLSGAARGGRAAGV